MNKGIAVARGEYCQFLNSGDWLYDENVIDKFNKSTNETDIILGYTALSTPKGLVARICSNDDISFINLFRGSIGHQSSFIRRSLFTYIPYDEKYKICSDWKFFLEALIIHNCTFSTVDFTIAYFDLNGISSTNQKLKTEEQEKILKELNIPPRILKDYESLDIDTLKIAQKLHPYIGLRHFVCKLTSYLIQIYKWISIK